MSPTKQSAASLLAGLVLGDEVHAFAAADAAFSLRSWPTLIKTARAWRVLPAISEAVTTLGVELPDEDRKLLRGYSQESAVQSTMVAYRAAELLSDLADLGIKAIPFKGVAMIAGLYGNPARRMVADIDILISEQCLEAADDALRSLGMKPDFDGTHEEYRNYLCSRALASNHSMVYRSMEGIEIDVHWRLGENRDAAAYVDTLLTRASEARLMRKQIYVPGPTDSILLTVHHVIRSNLALASLLKDLHDLVSWYVLHPAAWSVKELFMRAQTLDMETAVMACWDVLARFNENEALAEGRKFFSSRMTAEQLRDSSDIAALMACRIEEGRANRDLVALYQQGAMKNWFASRVFKGRHRRHLEKAPQPAPINPICRLYRLVAAVSRQHASERAGYRALAMVRGRLMGNTHKGTSINTFFAAP